MIIKSKDNIDVDVTHCDAAHPPGEYKGLNVNTRAVWVKVANGKWIRSRFANAMRVASEVRHSNAVDIPAAIGEIKEIV